MSRLGKAVLLLVVAAALAVVAIDALAIAGARRDVERASVAAADAAEGVYFATGNVVDANAAAERVATELDVVLIGFTIETGGGVRVTTATTAGSYVVGRIGPLHKYVEVTATVTVPPRAGPPPSTTSTTKAG